MKQAIVLLLFAASVFSCEKQHDHKNAVQQGHAMISLPTIQCETCVATIQAAVKKVDGVISVNIDLKEKMAHVNFDAAKTNQGKIEKAIADAGYDANDLKRDETAHAKLPACCQLKRE
jgi:periplasmic mercuric ion binding protein